MHGTASAVGTACAIRTITSSVPHTGSSAISSSTGMNNEYTAGRTRNAPTSSAKTRRIRRGPHRCNEIGARGGASERNCATRSRPSRFMSVRSSVGLAIPRTAANASAISSGVKTASARAVDALGVGAHRQHQHHVGQVDRLPPGRRADLGEGHVDELEMPVQHEQVGGLDVTVGDAGVPEPADQGQPLVDDLVVDLGVPDLLGAVEELGHHQVLALGRQLDDAHRLGGRDARVAQQAHGVVLVLDEPAHGLVRPFILQAPVQDRAAELVPAVGPHMVHGVELPEQVRVRALRRRAAAGASSHPNRPARRARSPRR